ncbi:MAG: STAS domain-containing protein [Terracidiphilus sp.]|jgi:anti-anti-sigma regulatory factor
MTGTISNPIDTAIIPTGELVGLIGLSDLTELVRGTEQILLARVTPLVRRQSVTLDLGRVERIDAAGIAALISLHASAYESAHCFNVANATPRVAEILSLVGLERILMSRITVDKSYSDSCLERPAA